MASSFINRINPNWSTLTRNLPRPLQTLGPEPNQDDTQRRLSISKSPAILVSDYLSYCETKIKHCFITDRYLSNNVIRQIESNGFKGGFEPDSGIMQCSYHFHRIWDSPFTKVCPIWSVSSSMWTKSMTRRWTPSTNYPICNGCKGKYYFLRLFFIDLLDSTGVEILWNGAGTCRTMFCGSTTTASRRPSSFVKCKSIVNQANKSYAFAIDPETQRPCLVKMRWRRMLENNVIEDIKEQTFWNLSSLTYL